MPSGLDLAVQNLISGYLEWGGPRKIQSLSRVFHQRFWNAVLLHKLEQMIVDPSSEVERTGQ
ncbi:hypothetical protein MUK42_33257 [Musa troglodytarum]|uniref:Uncharacterized protein n=1 Tax=Musa troglodytarum TaxID=320322 RepID=A0A9E7JTR8_9LILI|nr:hypothetical protein MUK42_33257 [Musa troglodytarum]